MLAPVARERRAAARDVFPFRLGRQAVALAALCREPLGIGTRIVPAHADDRLVVARRRGEARIAPAAIVVLDPLAAGPHAAARRRTSRRSPRRSGGYSPTVISRLEIRNGRENESATAGDSPVAASSSGASGAEPIWNWPGRHERELRAGRRSRAARPAGAVCGVAGDAASNRRQPGTRLSSLLRSLRARGRARRESPCRPRARRPAPTRAQPLRLSSGGVSQLPPRCTRSPQPPIHSQARAVARAADVAAPSRSPAPTRATLPIMSCRPKALAPNWPTGARSA